MRTTDTMLAMAGPGERPRDSVEPGEPAGPGDGPRPRLAEAPSARYAAAARTDPSPEGGGAAGSTLNAPLARAVLVALASAAVLVLVGAVLASTFGLLFVAGLGGAAVGLVLSRAATPPDGARIATPRRTVVRLAIVVALGMVALGAVATWAVARWEGGTLGLFDYLLTAFGPFVPAEAVVAALAAAWGAATGPVQG